MGARSSYLSPAAGPGISYGIIAATLCFIYLAIYVFQARVDITLEMQTPQPTNFKIYWAAPNQAYSENRMAYAKLDAAINKEHLYIASLGGIERIRIDPIEFEGTVNLRELHINQYGFAPFSLSPEVSTSQLKPNSQIRILNSDPGDGLKLQTTGKDGNLELILAPQRQWTVPFRQLLILAALLVGSGLALRALRPLLTENRFVPWTLSLAFLLILTMALTTGLHLHPDEVVHFEAVEYYASHPLPPALDAEEIASSYSIYGHTRLSQFEAYYVLAGYFQSLPASLEVSSLFTARSFNLVLFALLIYLAFRHPGSRSILLPLIISAQAWYLFSYTNSDAFALALALFISYLAAWPDSLLNRFLSEARPSAFGLKLIVLGFLFGCLLLLKANYYIFILFLGLYLLWRIRRGAFPEQRRLWQRVLMLALIASSLFGVRMALDIHANGWDRAELKMQMQEKHAIDAYKPSAPQELKHPMLDIRDRGLSLGYALVNARWFERSFQSAFGVYGFTDFQAPQHYYDMLRIIGLLLLAALLLSAARGHSEGYLSLLFIVAVCTLILLSASIWNSWTVVFQPQGRYLLPVLPMLSVFFYHVRSHAPTGLVESLCMLMFGLAAWSFTTIGINNMSSIAG